jgi:hypothetical protein
MSFFPPIYYNSQFEHPIRWDKSRKRFEEKKLADECFNVWQSQKQLERFERNREQANVRLQ